MKVKVAECKNDLPVCSVLNQHFSQISNLLYLVAPHKLGII